MTAANSVIDDFGSWIAALPCPIPFPIVSPSTCGRSILLSSDSSYNPTASTTFSISLTNPTKTLWISEPIPCSTPNPHLLLLLQLLHEAVAIPPHTLMPKPDPDRLLPALDSYSDDTSALLYLALLCHLFQLCAGDSPADAGLLFFGSLDAALAAALNCRRSLGAFLFALGADREELFMRSVGHMVAKWCILGELTACKEKRPFHTGRCLAYATEVLL